MTKRSERTRSAVKGALLEQLEKHRLDAITMTQLAEAASVSRSTLYTHYANTREIFDDAVLDFLRGLRPLGIHLHCGDCIAEAEGSRPFCVALREAGKYRPLVSDPAFIRTAFRLIDDHRLFAGDYGEDSDALPDQRDRRALFLFRVSGCYTVAMDEEAGEDWSSVQRLLDNYIRGGMAAVRQGAPKPLR